MMPCAVQDLCRFQEKSQDCRPIKSFSLSFGGCGQCALWCNRGMVQVHAFSFPLLFFPYRMGDRGLWKSHALRAKCRVVHDTLWGTVWYGAIWCWVHCSPEEIMAHASFIAGRSEHCAGSCCPLFPRSRARAAAGSMWTEIVVLQTSCASSGVCFTCWLCSFHPEITFLSWHYLLW